ncbi:hypothetical protein ACTFIY_011041 [Dictyostelium cf. discoideum]
MIKSYYLFFIILIFLIFINNFILCEKNNNKNNNNNNNYPFINVDKIIYTNSSNSIYLVWSNEQFNLILQSSCNEEFDDIVMIGEYFDKIETTGWGELNITFNSNSATIQISDNEQAYFTGFIESVLTGERINQMYNNFAASEFTNSDHTPSPKLIDFLNTQMEFVRDQIFENNASSQYWYSTGLIMSQFDGLVNGYQQSPFPQLSEIQLYILTSAGDLETLVTLFPSTTTNENENENKNKNIKISSIKPNFKDELTDCSGFIRILPDYSDVYFGHTTWRYYYALLRIYKFINLQFSYQDTPMEYRVSFSSSPGFISSKDDFYITGNKLAIMETTNNIYNESLYQYTIPQSVLVWQRAMIANMIATNSSDWVKIFSEFNSGTYQNQWMVFDYKLFIPNNQQQQQHQQQQQQQSLPPNTFWIAEQIPGQVLTADLTDILNEQGYWKSYNIPYFETIYNISGYSEKTDLPPSYQYSYEKCPRSLIFSRNASDVLNFEDMKSLMQFNNYKTDPLSYSSPLNSISSRGDLLTIENGNRSAVAFGGVDSKITSFNQVLTLSCTAISGPSTNGGTLPPFTWSQSPLFQNITHIGVPETFNFDWQEMGPYSN